MTSPGGVFGNQTFTILLNNMETIRARPRFGAHGRRLGLFALSPDFQSRPRCGKHETEPTAVIAKGRKRTPVALEIATELSERGISGQLTVIVEGLPVGATLSAGTNNWDRTWSLAAKDLDGLKFYPPNGGDDDHVLAVRVLRFDDDGYEAANTVALFDMSVHVSKAGTSAADTKSAEQEQLAVAEWEEAAAERLTAAKAKWEETAEKSLTVARKAWEKETARYAAAAKKKWDTEAKKNLSHAKAQWKAAQSERIANAKALWAEEEAQQLSALNTTWQAESQARSSDSKADWQAAEQKRLAAEKSAWQKEEERHLAAAKTAWDKQASERLAVAKAAWEPLAEQRIATAKIAWEAGLEQNLTEAMARWRAKEEKQLAKFHATWQREEERRLAADKSVWDKQASERLAVTKAAWEAELDQNLTEAKARWRVEEEKQLAKAHAAWEKESDRGNGAKRPQSAANIKEALAAARSAWEMEADQRLEEAESQWRTDTEMRIDEIRIAFDTETNKQLKKAEKRWKADEELRLAAAKKTWKAELDQKLAKAESKVSSKSTANVDDALAAARSVWEAEADQRLKEAESQWRTDVEMRVNEIRATFDNEARASLKKAEARWRADEEARLAAAKKAWQTAVTEQPTPTVPPTIKSIRGDGKTKSGADGAATATDTLYDESDSEWQREVIARRAATDAKQEIEVAKEDVQARRKQAKIEIWRNTEERHRKTTAQVMKRISGSRTGRWRVAAVLICVGLAGAGVVQMVRTGTNPRAVFDRITASNQDILYVRAESAIVRAEASPDSTVLNSLSRDTAIRELRRRGKWVQVALPGSDEPLGWMYETLLRPEVAATR